MTDRFEQVPVLALPAVGGWQAALTTERKILAGFVFALFTLAVIAIASLSSATRLSRDAERTRSAQEIIASLNLVLSLATDVETAQRGYIITGDESYLEPHSRAEQSIMSEIERLRRLSADDPSFRQKLAALEPALQERIVRTEENIALRRSAGFAAAQASIATGRGKALHDRIRAIIADMIAGEEALLNDRQEATRQATTMTRIIIASGSVLAFGVVIIALLAITRDMAGTRRAEAALQAVKVSLQERVQKRTAELEEACQLVRERELHLRTVTALAGVGLVIVDAQHCYRYVNRAYQEILGFEERNLVGARVADVRPAAYATQIQPSLNLALAGRSVSYELRLPPVAPETADRYYTVSFEPGTDASGKIVVIVFADITQLKRTEARLRESLRETAELRTALNEHAIVAVTDPQGRITEVNDKFCALSQFSREELLGQDHRIINSGTHSKAFFRNLWNTIREGRVWQGDIKNRAKDGSFYWVSTTIVPFIDANGQPRQYVALRVDITARKLDEEARSRLSGIVRSSSDAIIGKTLNGIITSWNNGAEKVFGYTAEEAVGQPMLMLFPPENVDEERKILARIARDETVPHFETERIRKDGQRIIVSVTISPVQDSEGRVVGASKIARDITAQKQVDEERWKLAQLIEHSRDLITVANLDGVITFMNSGARRMVGVGDQEALGTLRITDYVPASWQDFFRDTVLTMTRERGLWEGEMQLRHLHSGEAIDVFRSTFLLRGPVGDPAAYATVTRDITDQKRSATALRASEERLHAVTENLSEGLIIASLSGELIHWNRAGLAMHGYHQLEEALGQLPKFAELFCVRSLAGEELKFADWPLPRVLRGERLQDFEVRLRSRSAAWEKVISFSGAIIHDATGKPLAFLSMTDITERRKAEEALRASEARYRSLFEYAPDGILIVGPDGRYLDANASMSRMLGYTRAELIGADAATVVAPEEVEHIDPALDLIRGRAPHHREWQFRRKDHSQFPAEVIGAMMPDGNVLGMIRDVSERKIADASLREAERGQRLAFEANRLKSEFLANMSHELRTPLNCIIGFTEFLIDEKPGALNAKQKEYLSDVHQSSNHLLQLINDVLDLAKVEAGKVEFHPETFQVARAIEEVCAVVTGIAQQKRIQITAHIPTTLGCVVLDQKKFKQICYNLLANAVKFTGPDGSVEINVANCGTNAFEVKVADTGIGIRRDDLPKLFREFERLETSATRHYEGTGLGLALTKKLVERQGGSIRVESEYGKGSIFAFILPMRAETLGAI
jgi:PAS domain S-box-containing protein